MSDLLPVEEAQQRILAVFRPVGQESCPLADALDRVLAEEIQAGADLPPFTNSSMDGFAVRAEDVCEATRSQPVRLRVVEDIPAGSMPTANLKRGEAARIMTGAPLPEGADAVVPVEETDADGSGLPEAVDIYQGEKAGSYVRPRGQDIRAGQVILRPGKKLAPQDLGMLAMLGAAEVSVYRRPKIALLSSGDELVGPEEALRPGKIRDANSYTLAGLIERAGGEVVRLGRAPDDPGVIRARLDQAVREQADLILTSAGVSVGAFDYIKTIIEEQGRLDFWRVDMRPGKPVAFGSYQGIPLIGLPGNPVSAFVTFLVFVLPALRRLAGFAEARPVRRKAVLDHDLTSDGRESYLRAVYREEVDGGHVSLTGDQNSGNLYSLVQGNALLIVPSGVKSLPSGAVVEIWPILEV